MDIMGGVKPLSCANSSRSSVRLMYTALNSMHASSGEMSTSAHRPEMPSSIATAKMSRLSLLREGLSSLDSKNPQPAPTERAAMFHTTGRTISHTPGRPSAPTTAAATQYTNRQTTSSSATTCISASTNGPFFGVVLPDGHHRARRRGRRRNGRDEQRKVGAQAEQQPHREENDHARKQRLKERDNQNPRSGRADDLALEVAADVEGDEGQRNVADKAHPVHRRLRISPSAPGPMSRPAMMKPLTLGSRSSFVTRVTRNPANNIMEREMRA